MNFSQGNRKLEILFNKIKENDATLKAKDVEALIFTFFKQNFQNTIVLQDSGWLAKAIDLADDISTVIANSSLATSVSINFSSNLELPNFLQPFVEPLIFLRPPPNCTLSAYTERETSLFTNDFVVVRGDGSLIFQGGFTTVDLSTIFSETFLTTYSIPFSHTKKAWTVNLNSGAHIGQAVEITWTKTVGNITTSFDTFPINSPNHKHEILDADEDSFTAVGNETIIDTTPNPTIFNENVTRTFNFSDADSYSISIRGGAPLFTVTLYASVDIDSQEFTFAGRQLYFDNETYDQFQMKKVGNDIQLNSFPESNLPYTNITLEKNPEGYPNFIDNNYRVNKQIFPEESSNNLGVGTNNIGKDIGVFKIDDTTRNSAIYKFNVKIGAIVHVPASELVIDNGILTQSDTYNIDSTSYIRTSNVTDSKSEGSYAIPPLDVAYRVIFVVNNPLQFKEIRKYDTP